MRYLIVQGTVVGGELAERVNFWIDKGWRPYGSPWGDAGWNFQALTYEETKHKKKRTNAPIQKEES